MSETAVKTKNIVIVGDGEVGKTCLLYSFTNGGAFRTSYVPTIYDKEVFELALDNTVHSIKLHDTAGQEDFQQLRKIIYKEADCFIVCYSIANRNSFDNVLHKWYPELKSFQCPIVLVGTKSDLCMLQGSVFASEGKKLQHQIQANAFIECSAKNNEHVLDVFHEAVRSAEKGIDPPEKEEEDNCFMTCFSCFYTN